MKRRLRLFLVLTALIACNGVLLIGNAPSTVSADSTLQSSCVAARWYHRARQGQLNYRSTRSGRSTRHTVEPQSVQPRQQYQYR
ncbi:hypothetical protein Pan181_27230 [Aeoliella mucimassa]|uniref:Lipoprotein n=1 Tax=Aeoliella mucimassa TaxID=2527972 RepID=A0A518AP64_9BACT|nr:hypothetical protein Pan181_27230 [Aeoliella mucimassa]